MIDEKHYYSYEPCQQSERNQICMQMFLPWERIHFFLDLPTLWTKPILHFAIAVAIAIHVSKSSHQ